MAAFTKINKVPHILVIVPVACTRFGSELHQEVLGIVFLNAFVPNASRCLSR